MDNLKSKEILVAILNRNDPDKGDSLHKFFLKNNYKNIFLLENGTEITNTSKNFNKRIIPTKGVAWGVNYICKVFQKSSFNFLWLNFNDVKFKNFEIAENWILKKQLSNLVSNKKLDEIYQFALSKGALGGKLLGAGGGGFFLFIVPNKKVKHNLKESLTKKGLPNINFNIDFTGTQIIYHKESDDF